MVALHDQTLLEVLEQIVHIDQGEVLLTLSKLLVEVFLKALYARYVIRDVVSLVDFLSFRKVTLKFQINRSLILLEIDLPPIEILQLPAGQTLKARLAANRASKGSKDA